jgi:hypothetical protein
LRYLPATKQAVLREGLGGETSPETLRFPTLQWQVQSAVAEGLGSSHLPSSSGWDRISDAIGDTLGDTMKGKLSATVEEPLLEFLDSLPGNTRSEKLELILKKFRELEEERLLRRQLSELSEDQDEEWERDVWEQTVSEAMWSE